MRQISQPFVDLGEMARGDLAHVGAAAARVFVQHQKVAAVLQRKVEPSRTAQEAQPVDVSGAEIAIAVDFHPELTRVGVNPSGWTTGP